MGVPNALVQKIQEQIHFQTLMNGQLCQVGFTVVYTSCEPSVKAVRYAERESLKFIKVLLGLAAPLSGCCG
jgi:hypothetical protein